jgi:hypothetical protein
MQIEKDAQSRVLPSPRSEAEKLGCGTGRDCFFTIELGAEQLDTLRAALDANDDRNDDYQRARIARIKRDIDAGGFSVWIASPWGWMPALPYRQAFPFSLPEFITNGLKLSNHRYERWDNQDIDYSDPVVSFGAKLWADESNRRADELFHEVNRQADVTREYTFIREVEEAIAMRQQLRKQDAARER